MWSPAPPSAAIPSQTAGVTFPGRYQETTLESIATHTRGTRLFWGGLLAPLQLQVDLEGSTEMLSWSRKEGSGHREWLCQREGASSDQPLSQPGSLG